MRRYSSPLSRLPLRILGGALIFVCTLLSGLPSWAQDKSTSIYPDGWEDESCTSIMVGRLASGDGSVMTSHTCDGVSHTWSCIEPARDYRKGEMFTVYKGLRHTSFREDTTGVKKVGEIPQVRHTYAYLNTGYPCLNEKQLAIGESTFTGPDTLINKNSMFLIEELCRLALQRCDNARDAIRLMGSIAEKYGYGDTGECLTVADKKEVWAFEILGVGRNELGAVWAAQRVPDDHVAVSCNIPRIGKLDLGNKDYFMASDNVKEVALRYGLWDGQGEFIFWKAYNVPRAKGKNFAVRDWFILNTIAPSLGLTMDDDEMPFSVKPEFPVDLRTVSRILRSTYEGTEHDMCRNVLIEKTLKNGQKDTVISPIANPWLTADTRNTLNMIAPGTIDFRRTVSVAWCAYSTILQLRADLPDNIGGVCWLSPDNPGESPRIPVFSGSRNLPDAFKMCGHKKYVPDSFLWTFRRANRLGTLAWQTHKGTFEKNILEVEDFALSGLKELEGQRKVSSEQLDALTAKVFDEAASRWKTMEWDLWHDHGRGF